MSLEQHALEYLSRGFAPIPLQGRYAADADEAKKPFPRMPWKQWQGFKPEPSHIRAWFQQKPLADIGILTGPHYNRLVLDVDGEEGARSVAGRELPQTLISQTGKGIHYVYEWDARLNAVSTTLRGILPGVDTRGAGGYIVAPPSTGVQDSPRYRWVTPFDSTPVAPPPEWLVQLLLSRVKDVQPLEYSQSFEPWVEALLGGVAEGEGRVPALARLTGYFFRKLPSGIAWKILIDWNEKNSPPIPDDKFVSTVNDVVRRYGVREQAEPVEEGQLIVPADVELKEYEHFLETRGEHPEIELSTGFPAIDALTGGLIRTEYVALAAYSGVGKSNLAINFSYHLTQAGKKVLYLPTEMPKKEIHTRYFAIATGVAHRHFFTGRLTAEERAQFEAFKPVFKQNMFKVVEEHRPALSLVRRAMESFAPDVVVVDYVQHVKLDQNNRRTEIDEFVMGFKKLLKDMNIAAVLVAQPTKAKRDMAGNVIPISQHDLAESSGILKESGCVVLLHGEDPLFRVEVQKNRYGTPGEVFLGFDKVTTRFFPNA